MRNAVGCEVAAVLVTAAAPALLVCIGSEGQRGTASLVSLGVIKLLLRAALIL